MFLTIQRHPVPLVTGADPVINSLVNLMPDYSGGARLHSLYVNKLQGSLPGNYSQMFGTGPAFRSIFFPNWQADPLLGLVGNTGLDDRWWSAFSVAVLCQAIAELGSDIRGQMLSDKINADVGGFNNSLRERSATTYAFVLAQTYPPLTTLLRQIDPSSAKQQFRACLLDNVLTRQLWYQAGMWTSPDWEMFNQYAKYLALGASPAEVDTLINDLATAGLPIPPQVGLTGWRQYAEELRDKPTIDRTDILDASQQAILETTYLPTPGGYPARMPNGNCYEFTANSQPGNPYRRPAGGSCFTASTQVLNGRGDPIPLSQIQPGDTVLTKDGVGTVEYVGQPVRGGRPLMTFDSGGPVFTATHPFVNAGPATTVSPPSLLAVDPVTLAWAVPTLGENGIGNLAPGAQVLARAPGPDRQPIVVPVTGIRDVPPTQEDTYLRDLRILDPSGAPQAFWAGDGQHFYLVAPEFPIVDQIGPAATTVVAIMEGLLRSGGPDGGGWPEWVIEAVERFGPGIFQDALTEALAATPSFGAPAPAEPLSVRIERLFRELQPATQPTASVVATMFDGLLAAAGQWLAALVDLGWRSSNVLGGDILAVTIFDIALTPANPLPESGPIILTLEVKGSTSSDQVRIWDRPGGANSRFTRRFDQVLHIDLAGEDRPADLSFSVGIQGAPVECLVAGIPGGQRISGHCLYSIPLRDLQDSVVGTIRFDTRPIGQDIAGAELGRSGRWTTEVAEAYANALGLAMVDPIMWKLRQLAPAFLP